MQNEDLMRAYKNTRKLIQENPENKETIINEYIDLVEKINIYKSKSISNSTNNELSKLLKNPLEIAIYNNFQRFNDNFDNDNNNNDRKNNSINSKEDSTKFLTSIYDLKYK
jgi:hypothetical protein